MLSKDLSLKDLGSLHYFLGIEASTTSEGNLHLFQTRYIKEILHRTNMLESRAQPTPMISFLRLTKNASTAVQDPTLYRSVVGALQYVLITRPELSFAVNKVCQFMHCPQEHHWRVVKRILRYLARTENHGLIIQRSQHKSIIGFSDADWATNTDDRKSTTGYCIYFGANIVSWSSHKQKVVSRSSTEAEYRSIAAVLAEILWLTSLLQELHISTEVPKIYSDNLGAVQLAANPIMHSRTKHFELDFHFVRDTIQQMRAQLIHLPAQFQIPDILTKPISGTTFSRIRDKLMVVINPTISLRGMLNIINNTIT